MTSDDLRGRIITKPLQKIISLFSFNPNDMNPAFLKSFEQSQNQLRFYFKFRSKMICYTSILTKRYIAGSSNILDFFIDNISVTFAGHGWYLTHSWISHESLLCSAFLLLYAHRDLTLI